jgi:hypothetical protein
MSQEGAAPPPPGVEPNFDNPSGGVHFWLIFAQFLCIPIVTVFVALRIYVKIFMQHEFYLEDCKLVVRLSMVSAQRLLTCTW